MTYHLVNLVGNFRAVQYICTGGSSADHPVRGQV